jgi:hypothetical protein
MTATRIIQIAKVRGWKITAREADCRCWATESAMSFRAARRSIVLVSTYVVRGGTPARGSESDVELRAWEVESGEGEGGGRFCEDAAPRTGVELLEDMAECVGGVTRFARRKVKNAVERSKVVS